MTSDHLFRTSKFDRAAEDGFGPPFKLRLHISGLRWAGREAACRESFAPCVPVAILRRRIQLASTRVASAGVDLGRWDARSHAEQMGRPSSISLRSKPGACVCGSAA